MTKRPGGAPGVPGALVAKIRPDLALKSALPLVAALLIVALAFQTANSSFLTPRNLSNLCLQLAAPGILTLGVMLVLLIGEIDLSIGAVSGLCASIMAAAEADLGLSAGPAVAAALLAGLAIGSAQGAAVVFLRAPSFIITLSGLLVWAGVHHILLGERVGELEINDPFVLAVASTFLPSWATIALLLLVFVAAFLPLALAPRSRGSLFRKLRVLARNALYAIGLATIAIVLGQRQGVPFLLVLLLTLTAGLTIVTESTQLGVHILAVGGNAELARRAGINVAVVRIAMFSSCSALAAMAGIVAASRQLAVDSTTGGGALALDAIAAAVIGGTSLFGGRGRALGALLGSVVVASVENGLDLLGLSGDFKSIATGSMLFLAVSFDMGLRRYRDVIDLADDFTDAMRRLD